jgi:hypothetical protein
MSQRIAECDASLARTADEIRVLRSAAEDRDAQLGQTVERLDASQAEVNAVARFGMLRRSQWQLCWVRDRFRFRVGARVRVFLEMLLSPRTAASSVLMAAEHS